MLQEEAEGCGASTSQVAVPKTGNGQDRIPSGEYHEVEAFLKVEDGNITVKYANHEKPEIETIAHMKKELKDKNFKILMKRLTGI